MFLVAAEILPFQHEVNFFEIKNLVEKFIRDSADRLHSYPLNVTET